MLLARRAPDSRVVLPVCIVVRSRIAGRQGAIRTTLRRAGPGAPSEAHLGAISFFHRFGSSLNVHPHYHLVVLDGVFSKAGDSEIEFHEASELTHNHIRRLEPDLILRRLTHGRFGPCVSQTAWPRKRRFWDALSLCRSSRRDLLGRLPDLRGQVSSVPPEVAQHLA